MTVSVPQVHPIEDLKWRIATLIERGLDIYRSTGDLTLFEQSTQLARELYDGELKLAGNKGIMDWAYIDECGRAIGKVESIVQKIKARHDAA